MPLLNRVGGGGGIPQLPEQVDNVTISPGDLSAILTWSNPVNDENSSYVGVRIVRKEGSCPNNKSDGTVVYEGSANEYTDTGLTEGVTYYYRFFAYNADGKYQNSMRAVYLSAISAYRWKKYQVTYSLSTATTSQTMDSKGGTGGFGTASCSTKLSDSISVSPDGEISLVNPTSKSFSYTATSSSSSKTFGTTDVKGKYISFAYSGNSYIGKLIDSSTCIRGSGSTWTMPNGSTNYNSTLTAKYYEIDTSSIETTDLGEVLDIDINAYPENGYQDGYWYVLQTAL